MQCKEEDGPPPKFKSSGPKPLTPKSPRTNPNPVQTQNQEVNEKTKGHKGSILDLYRAQGVSL